LKKNSAAIFQNVWETVACMAIRERRSRLVKLNSWMKYGHM
jgi:hypothetical protein